MTESKNIENDRHKWISSQSDIWTYREIKKDEKKIRRIRRIDGEADKLENI